MSDYQPVIPVRVRTARKPHRCDGFLCTTPILPGDRYEDHRLPPGGEMGYRHWVRHKVHLGGSGSGTGCDEAAAYAEKAAREQAK
jgi:hypothetical protein